jgi:hypothetical protein
MLPRKKRTAGARKIGFPYGLAGLLILTAGPAFVLYLGFSSHWHSRFLYASTRALLQVGVPVAFVCFYLWNRSRLATADTILETDPRPPVLYLRAFTYEEQLFVHLDTWQASKYTSKLGSTYGATLEQYFSLAIRESIGPFVALGNPFDYLPPEGASRIYEPDRSWQESFLKLARESACIIIQVGESGNLAWELKTLKVEGLLEKVFIFVRPAKRFNAPNRFSEAINRLKHRIKGVKLVAWSDFAAGLCAMGYQIDLAEPSAGSIFSFNREGTAVLLAAGAKEPSDYVTRMLERLRSTAATRDSTVGPSEPAPDLVTAPVRQPATRQRRRRAS